MTVSRLSLLSCGALFSLMPVQAADLCHSGRAQSPVAITQADINVPALPPLQTDYLLNYPDGFDLDVFRDWKAALAKKP